MMADFRLRHGVEVKHGDAARPRRPLRRPRTQFNNDTATANTANTANSARIVTTRGTAKSLKAFPAHCNLASMRRRSTHRSRCSLGVI